VIIGFAGGSCSGKSTLARALSTRMGCAHICLDDYFRDPRTFPVVYGRPDYDRLEAVDWEEAMAAIAAVDGDVIVEGFLALAHKPLREMLDVAFFVDTPAPVRLSRRLQRDNRTPADRDYITFHIPARYEELVAPTKVHADTVLDGTRDLDGMMASVLASLPSRALPLPTRRTRTERQADPLSDRRLEGIS
jgi:uridine kinase